MPERIAQHVYAERTNLLYQNGKGSSVVLILSTLMLSAIMYGQIDNLTNFTWLAAILLAAGWRLWLINRRDRSPDSRPAQTWIRLYTLPIVAIAACWCWFVLIGYGHNAWLNMVVLLIVLAMTSLAVPVLVPFPAIMRLYFLPALLTVILLLLMQQNVNDALLAAGVVFYGTVVMHTAMNFFNMMTDSLRLRFEKELLANDLNEQKSDAENLNRQLEREIDVRRTTQHALEDHQRDLENQVSHRTAELEEAKEAAEAGSRAKSDFLASISHEIRTPMNGVLGITQLLLKGQLDPHQQHYVQIAHDSATNLLRLIDDVLDFSKIESGQLSLNEEDFNLLEVAREAMQMLEHSARDKGIELVFDPAPGIHTTFLGDSYRLRQVLLNLLSNALKFTEQGHVRLAISERSQDDTSILHFEVQDTGIGIDAGALEQIFSEFTQEDGSITRRFGGTGLGLSISRGLVEALGGTISVDSSKGHGSTFRFDLPLKRSTQQLPETASERPSVEVAATIRFSGRVLVAEDNEINQIIACDHLESLGFEVDTVDNGLQAREARARGNYRFVLMDCHMPEMDGFDATEAIRVDEEREGWTHIPIIALTADAQAEARDRCSSVGMDGYLVKPFDTQSLIEQISTCMAGAGKAGATP